MERDIEKGRMGERRSLKTWEEKKDKYNYMGQRQWGGT